MHKQATEKILEQVSAINLAHLLNNTYLLTRETSR